LVYLSSPEEEISEQRVSSWEKLGDFPGLRGYSVSAATLDGGFAFFAGSTGIVYCFDHQSGTTCQISKIDGKVAALYAECTPPGTKYCVSLVTAYLGRNLAQIALLRRGMSGKLESFDGYTIDSLTSPVTSAVFVVGNENLLVLGCRNGSINLYLATTPTVEDQSDRTFFSLKHTIEGAHDKETVTNVRWIPDQSGDLETFGSILSAGRDGTCCIHAVNKELESWLVHKLSLPFGPNIEGLWINPVTSKLFVYGFQGTGFLLYNMTAFQEVMSINCGGAHRNWAFRPRINPSDPGRVGGEFSWIQASNLKLSSTSEPSYEILQSGGHGREIKACAVAPVALPGSTTGPLIATGAEDTDIRLFKYLKGATEGFICVATLRKHDSGIQDLKWSNDGRYLFSSGGHQEFFIWRVQAVPILAIGVVCESVCPEGKGMSELRITAFDIEDLTGLDDSLDGVSKVRAHFLITLVYCNSIVKVNCSFCAYQQFAKHLKRLFDIHRTEGWATGQFLVQEDTHQHA
jgi:WD40 repeat protein